MGYIKEPDGFDIIVEPSRLSILERKKICRYIDKLKKQDKLAEERKKAVKKRTHKKQLA
jgi:hypothetical protein